MYVISILIVGTVRFFFQCLHVLYVNILMYIMDIRIFLKHQYYLIFVVIMNLHVCFVSFNIDSYGNHSIRIKEYAQHSIFLL